MSSRRNALPALLLAAFFAIAGCAGEGEGSGDGHRTREDRTREAERSSAEERSNPRSADRSLSSYGSVHTVTDVTDGDTVEVEPDLAGRGSVRLLLMDTPETYGGEEPLGSEATAYAERRLEGERVALETDVEELDPYDRALGYVWLEDGTLFNEEIVRRGLAQLAVFKPNVLYEDRIRGAQEEARGAGRGIWGLPPAQRCELADRDNPDMGEGSHECEGASGGAPGESDGSGVPPEGEDDCPARAPIKGNDSDGELIHHPLDGQYYDVTNPEECFASAGAAEAAGYRASER